MIVLDENIPASQRAILQAKRIHVRQIGVDIGNKGFDDERVIPILHKMSRPTFFTLDADFYKRRLRHEGYCLVHLVLDDKLIARYIRRVLRHRALNSKVKRMGNVIQVDLTGLAMWRIGQQEEIHLEWDR